MTFLNLFRLFAIILLLLTSSCTNITITTTDAKPEHSPSRIEKFSLVETSFGKRTLELTADIARINRITKIVKASNIVMKSYDVNEVLKSTLIGDEGEISLETNDMEAHGNVKVVSRTGTTLKTDWLKWIDSTQTINTDALVKIIQKDNILVGKGLVCDSELNDITIKEPNATIGDIEELEKEDLIAPAKQ